jgi:hypothetical protein
MRGDETGAILSMRTNTRYLGFLLLLLSIGAAYGQQSVPVRCDYWKIDWRSPSGKVWGTWFEDTKAKIVAYRDNTIRFEESYAREMHTSLDPNFTNPGPPTCVRLQATTKTKQKNLAEDTSDSVWQNNAKLMMDFWGGKMKDALKQYLQASGFFSSQPPAWMGASDIPNESSVGETFKEYAGLLKQTYQRVGELQSILSRVSQAGNDVSNEIARSTVQLEDSGYKLALAYYSLPAQVRSVYLPETYVPMKDTPTNEQLNTLCEQNNLRACADLWAQGVNVNFDQKIDEVKLKQQQAAEERKRQITAEQEAERQRQLEQRTLEMVDERTRDVEEEGRQAAQNTYAPAAPSYDPAAQESQMESEPNFAERLSNAWNTDNPIQDTLNEQLQRLREMSQAAQAARTNANTNANRKSSCPPGGGGAMCSNAAIDFSAR